MPFSYRIVQRRGAFGLSKIYKTPTLQRDIAGGLFLNHAQISQPDRGSLRNAAGVIPNCFPNRRVNDGSD